MAAGNGMTRVAIWVFGAIVAALVVSWAWTTYVPRARPRPPAAVGIARSERHVIRVQVWNGSGEGGVGARVASFLREGGFHVVEVKNADRQDYFATMVVARRDDTGAAEVVARYLGQPPVIRQAWTSEVAEVTVVIGSDRSRLHIDE